MTVMVFVSNFCQVNSSDVTKKWIFKTSRHPTKMHKEAWMYLEYPYITYITYNTLGC